MPLRIVDAAFASVRPQPQLQSSAFSAEALRVRFSAVIFARIDAGDVLDLRGVLDANGLSGSTRSTVASVKAGEHRSRLGDLGVEQPDGPLHQLPSRSNTNVVGSAEPPGRRCGSRASAIASG